MRPSLPSIAALAVAAACVIGAIPASADPENTSAPPANSAAPCLPMPAWDGTIQQDPQNAKALLARGEAYADKGAPDCAISDFTAALAQLPPDSDDRATVLTRRSAAYGAKGDLELAIADISAVIQFEPYNAAPLLMRGVLRNKKQNFAEAIDDFTDAITRDPENAQSFLGRGQAYADLDDNQHARDDFNQALKLDPNQATAYLDLGRIEQKSGNNGQAVAYFNQALQIAPHLFAAHVSRAQIYLDTGQFDLAIADYTQALETDAASAASLAGRATAYRARGDLIRAAADYERAIAQNPKDATTLYNLGLVYYYMNKYTDALRAFAAATDLTSDANAKFYPAYWSWLAKAKLGFNGMTVFSRVMAGMDDRLWPMPIAALYLGRLAPADLPATTTGAQPDQLCEAWFYQGEWYLQHSRQDAARAAFKAAVATGDFRRAEYDAARLELDKLGEKLD